MSDQRLGARRRSGNGADGISFFNYFPDPRLQRELMDGAELRNWAEFSAPALTTSQAISLVES